MTYCENFWKSEQVDIVENLPPIYLLYLFMHNLYPFLFKEIVKIFIFFLKPMNRIKLFVHRLLDKRVLHWLMTKLQIYFCVVS